MRHSVRCALISRKDTVSHPGEIDAFTSIYFRFLEEEAMPLPRATISRRTTQKGGHLSPAGANT